MRLRRRRYGRGLRARRRGRGKGWLAGRGAVRAGRALRVGAVGRAGGVGRRVAVDLRGGRGGMRLIGRAPHATTAHRSSTGQTHGRAHRVTARNRILREERGVIENDNQKHD